MSLLCPVSCPKPAYLLLSGINVSPLKRRKTNGAAWFLPSLRLPLKENFDGNTLAIWWWVPDRFGGCDFAWPGYDTCAPFRRRWRSAGRRPCGIGNRRCPGDSRRRDRVVGFDDSRCCRKLCTVGGADCRRRLPGLLGVALALFG